jgi:hypothetical protein
VRTTVDRIRVVVGAVAVLVAGVLMWSLTWVDSTGRRRYVLFDDAMISMSYSRTLVRGGGLVWFEGAPKVQGITNPGWTLLMAPINALTSSATMAALLVSLIGVGVLVGIGLLAVQLTDGTGDRTRLVAGLVVVTHFPLVYWTVRGMEVGALALLALLLVWLVVSGEWTRRREIAVALVIAFGVLVRFDFLLVGLVVAIVIAVHEGGRPGRRALVPFAATSVAAVVVVVAQKVYYGAWVPNTFTLKMSGGPLSERISAGLDSLLRHPHGVLMAGLAIWVAGRSHRTVQLLAMIALMLNAYSVWVGGDSWEFVSNRYHAVAVPLAAVALLLALHGRWAANRMAAVFVLAWCAVAQLRLNLPDRLVPDHANIAVMVVIVAAVVVFAVRSGPVMFGAVALVVFSSSGWVLDVGRGRVFDHDLDELRYERALVVREVTDDSAVIAVASAGTTVFVADRPAVDMLGKSDERIAAEARRVPFFPGHDKWDLQISIAEGHPDVVLDIVGDPAEAEAFLADHGYAHMCLAGHPDVLLWVRGDTTAVDLERLAPC